MNIKSKQHVHYFTTETRSLHVQNIPYMEENYITHVHANKTKHT